MERLRLLIEKQVLGVSGVALGNIDFSRPAGDAGLYGPDSVVWRVHGDFTSMMCGGISALLLQMLHPSALAGVWDHSDFREDMLGRLRRTAQFISGTSFGSYETAWTLIEKVKAIHERVSGVDSRGVPYRASDPALLTWVHVAEAHSFLSAHLRWCNPALGAEEQDKYYQEAARVAEALGARDIPDNRRAVAQYLQKMRPVLRCDERTREVTRLLLNAPLPGGMAKPMGRLMMRAGIDLLPDWARGQLQLSGTPGGAWSINPPLYLLAWVLRWAVRNGARHRAMVRVGRTL
ncbi:oxygenase MpaB family protein [Sodalis sp. dw_96]|uniref:oxygenase MpaB family protein n=1 Tax=Sodalis sp. dw_96 TaxID=2719794 RepID=UPI001BD5ECD3|nr:oxygenase MpaB family protein [Sodalis sp. dw_96]